ncbi:hypothetical protein [Tersicoccus sp. Bi-70]|uniref:hypothetical protein n=1 Tax=Tersicoccus sp. Bi-70 TaxID=1897634 RepID=UPI000975FE83|nr:hypothetical protein [Tersicoccus sp. Bi-70]OMH37109.1 hypothetical protein BGP79_15635 [Tersicoccus sp. Bi-70]
MGVGISARHRSIVDRRWEVLAGRLDRPRPVQAVLGPEERLTWPEKPIPVVVRLVWTDGRRSVNGAEAIGWSRRVVFVTLGEPVEERGTYVMVCAGQVRRRRTV